MMPYVRKSRKTYKKPYRSSKYNRTPVKSMRRIAQSVINRNVETKKQIATHGNSVSLLHNTPRLIVANLMLTTQGTDSDATGETRLGNQINPKGIKLYFQVRQYQPASATNHINGDISIKIWILKQHHSLVNNTADFLRNIVGNNTMNPVNTRRATVMKVINFKLKNLYSTWNAAPAVETAPAFKTLAVWIPLYKIKSYLYQENTTQHGKYFDVCMHAMAYGADQGLIVSDQIAEMDCSSEIFFKDP